MPDYYDIGNRATVETDELGLWMPQDVLDEMGTVNNEVAALDRDIAKAGDSLRPEFIMAWLSYREEWRKFYDGHQSWTSRVWNAAMDKVQEHKARIAKWKDALKKEGGKVTMPDIPVPGAFPWKWILGGAIAVAGLVAVSMTVKEVSGTVRALRGSESNG